MGVDGGIAGEQPHVLLAVSGYEIQVLLVAQCLNRRGVEGFVPPSQAQVDGELPHHCFSCTRRGRDEDAFSPLDGGAGLLLEGVEREVVAPGEAGELTAGGGLSTTGCGVALGW